MEIGIERAASLWIVCLCRVKNNMPLVLQNSMPLHLSTIIGTSRRISKRNRPKHEKEEGRRNHPHHYLVRKRRFFVFVYADYGTVVVLLTVVLRYSVEGGSHRPTGIQRTLLRYYYHPPRGKNTVRSNTTLANKPRSHHPASSPMPSLDKDKDKDNGDDDDNDDNVIAGG